jgi:hypothetical protein
LEYEEEVKMRKKKNKEMEEKKKFELNKIEI